MPRKPDLPCADCGTLMWRSKESLAPGAARCRPCRQKSPPLPDRHPEIAEIAADPAPELAPIVAGGNLLASLRAIRDHLAVNLDSCQSMRDVAALTQRLMDVLAQIDTAEQAQPLAEGTALDELTTRRRAAGRPDATASTRAARAAVRS